MAPLVVVGRALGSLPPLVLVLSNRVVLVSLLFPLLVMPRLYSVMIEEVPLP